MLDVLAGFVKKNGQLKWENGRWLFSHLYIHLWIWAVFYGFLLLQHLTECLK